jgi:hypothetical protein
LHRAADKPKEIERRKQLQKTKEIKYNKLDVNLRTNHWKGGESLASRISIGGAPHFAPRGWDELSPTGFILFK